MGKSKAQDELLRRFEEIYPSAYIDDEVYIGELIEERGFTMREMERELGHKPHRMFVDIVMRDSDRTVAIEYHGEQHYSLVGNMTKTSADLLLNQKLDREKSWILSRVGIPLIAVPFDMYIDEAVIEDLVEKATDQCIEDQNGMSACSECERLFPLSQLGSGGTCKSCQNKIREMLSSERKEKERSKAEEMRRERAQKRKEERKARRKAAKDNQSRRNSGSEEDLYKKEQKRKAKEYRQQKYQEWKESPEYAARKEEAKRLRKEQYQKAKAERKKQRRR